MLEFFFIVAGCYGANFAHYNLNIGAQGICILRSCNSHKPYAVEFANFSGNGESEGLCLSVCADVSTFNGDIIDLITVDINGISGEVEVDGQVGGDVGSDSEFGDGHCVEVFRAPSVNLVGVGDF